MTPAAGGTPLADPAAPAAAASGSGGPTALDTAVRIAARLSGGSCLYVAALHGIAVAGLALPPGWLVVPALPGLVLGQLAMVAGLKGGALFAPATPRPLAARIRLLRAGLARIPAPALWLTVGVWYLYTPWTLFRSIPYVRGHLAEVGGRTVLMNHGVVERVLTAVEVHAFQHHQFVSGSAVVMTLLAAQTVLLGHVIPARARILAEVDGSG